MGHGAAGEQGLRTEGEEKRVVVVVDDVLGRILILNFLVATAVFVWRSLVR
jgi:hypothetical protein